jgi:CheY-like chemotaxis protein
VERSLAHIPIIGLWAHAMNGNVEKARAAGCDNYLTKPLNEGLLFAMLDRFLEPVMYFGS